MKKEKRGKQAVAFLFLLFAILFSTSFISAVFSCTTGDIATTCYLNSSYNASNNEFINANNLVIQDNGNIFNNNSITLTINLTGDLTLIGKVNLSGYPHATAPGAGGRINIITNFLNLTLSGLLMSDGGKLTASGDGPYGGNGGTINITANSFSFLGNISAEGGDHAGTTNHGHGGNAGTIYINMNNNLNVQGNIFARGGTGEQDTCQAYTGYRGYGGRIIFNNQNYNVTLNSTIMFHMGELGGCNSDAWTSSLIAANNLLIGARANISINGFVNLTNNLDINGIFGLRGNLTVQNITIVSPLTPNITATLGFQGLNYMYSGMPGGFLNIVSNIINLTSSGMIEVDGGKMMVSVDNSYGGNAGIINITANTIYFNGNISVEGGDHAGTTSHGHGGNAGSIYFNLNSNLDVQGNILGRGGTGDQANCQSYTGYRGSGGKIIFDNPNYNVTLNGSVLFHMGELGGCNQDSWTSSLLRVNNLVVGTQGNVSINGFVNLTNNLDINGIFGLRGNLTAQNITIVAINTTTFVPTLGFQGLDYMYSGMPGGFLNIVSNIINLTSSGLITVAGGKMTSSVTSAYGGNAGTLNITANEIYFNGNISLDGGDHAGTANAGHGGAAGVLNLNISHNLDIQGNIFARGGTGQQDSCQSYTGYRGSGGAIIINNSNYNVTVNGTIDTHMGELGGCLNGYWSRSLVQVNNLLIGSRANFSMNGIVNLGNNLDIYGIFGLSGNLTAQNITIFNTLGDNGLTAYIASPRGYEGSSIRVISNIFNLTSSGIITANGGRFLVSSAGSAGGNGGILNFTANNFYINGNISMDGGDHPGTTSDGNGGNAGTIYFNTNSNLLISGHIFGRGGTADRDSCSGSSGVRGSGGAFYFNNPNYNVTLNSTIDFVMGEEGQCNSNLMGNSIISANNLLVTSRANISMGGFVNLTNNLDVNGLFGMRGNLTAENVTIVSNGGNYNAVLGFNGINTYYGNYYRSIDGGNLSIIVNILNLTSSGMITAKGGGLLVSASGHFAGYGGNINITANYFYFNGNISIEGGDHAGTTSDGNGGAGGNIYFNLNSNLNVQGNIFGRGGTSDRDSCSSSGGVNQRGGAIYFTNPNYNATINGTVDLYMGEEGQCNTNVWSNSSINANNLVIGNLANVSMNGVVNLTNNLYINGILGLRGNLTAQNITIASISGGNYNAILGLNGLNTIYGNYNRAFDGGNITIVCDVFNLTSSGLIVSNGGRINSGGDGHYAGNGGTINITTNALYFYGNISIEGGDHPGGNTGGNGGSGGNIYIYLNNNLNIQGNIFGRGGTAQQVGCSASSGNRGRGGGFFFNNSMYNLVLNGTMDLTMGEDGMCNNNLMSNSSIIANNLIIGNKANIAINGFVNLTNNLDVNGLFGFKGNLSAENITIASISGGSYNAILGLNGLDTLYGTPYRPIEGASITLTSNIFNLSSSGLITINGGKITSGGDNHYAANAGILNITANIFYFYGNISMEGGDHPGGNNGGNGGNGGIIYFKLNNNLDIQGNIFGRGGTAQQVSCSGTTGNRGRGGLIYFNNPNYNFTFNGTIDLRMGEDGQCNNDTWGNSIIQANKMIVGSKGNVSINGLVNLTNNLDITGYFGLRGNLTAQNITLVSTPGSLFFATLGYSGINSFYGWPAYSKGFAGGNLTVLANIFNLSSSGRIVSEGGTLTTGSDGHYGGNGGTINITANKFYFNGNLSVDAGDHAGGNNGGNGGNAGIVYLNSFNNLDMVGYILGRGGTGQQLSCSATSGNRGKGGLIFFNAGNFSSVNFTIYVSRGEMGLCNNGIGGNITVRSAGDLNISGTLDYQGNGNLTYPNGSLRLIYGQGIYISNFSFTNIPYFTNDNSYGNISFKSPVANYTRINWSTGQNPAVRISSNEIIIDTYSYPQLNQFSEMAFHNSDAYNIAVKYPFRKDYGEDINYPYQICYYPNCTRLVDGNEYVFNVTNITPIYTGSFTKYKLADVASNATSLGISSTNDSMNDTYQNLSMFISTFNYFGYNVSFDYNWYRNDNLFATNVLDDPSLVIYTPFNNDSLDYSAIFHSYDANGTNTIMNNSFGKIGGSYDYNGINSSMSYGNNIDYSANNFTLSFWFNPREVSRRQALFSRGNASNYQQGDIILFLNNSKINVNLRGSNSWLFGFDPSTMVSSSNLSNNNWYQLVFMKSDTNYSLYINNVLEASANDSRSIDDSTNTNRMLLGYMDAYASYFNGSIDEFLFYNRSLTSSELTQLYYGSVWGASQIDASMTSWNDTWILGVRSGDFYGWSYEKNSTPFKILDLTKPFIASIKPDNNTYSMNVTYNFTANFSDDDSGVKNASVYLNGVLNQTVSYVQGSLSGSVGIVIILADGIYNWLYEVFDWGGNLFRTENRTLVVDTIAPMIEFKNPTPENNATRSFVFTLNVSIEDINLDYLIFDFNSTNTTININSPNLTTTGNASYILNYNQNLQVGLIYYYLIYAFDKSGNLNFTETRNIIANVPPRIASVTQLPINQATLDPGNNVSVTVNISDQDYNLESAFLQWKNSSMDWSEAYLLPMMNMSDLSNTSISTIFNTNFTAPTYADLISYRIFTNDSFGAVTYSNITDISLGWDCNWELSAYSLPEVSGYNQDREMGIVTIRNTGDQLYEVNNCTLKFNLVTTGFNDDYNTLVLDDSLWSTSNRFLQYTKSIELNASQEYNLTIIGSFPIVSSALSLQTPKISVSSKLNGTLFNGSSQGRASEIINLNMIVIPPGPYLFSKIRTPQVNNFDLTSQEINFSGYVRNMGGDGNLINTAHNVSLDWILPELFKLASGNLNISFDAINDSTIFNENNLSLSFDASNLKDLKPYPFVYTLELYSSGLNYTGGVIKHYGNITVINSKLNITFSCYNVSDGIEVSACGSLDPDNPITGNETIINTIGGGAGGGGGGASSGPRVEKSEANYELLRGGKQNFQLEVKNKYGDEMRNITISVSGLNSEYISIVPNLISSLAPGATRNITITISAPGYFTGKKYDLIFDITGGLVSNATSGALAQVTDKRYVTLYIVEVDRKDATTNINESYLLIAEMNSSGLITKEVQALLTDQLKAYGELNFLSVKTIYDQIKKIRDNAFESKQLIAEITASIAESEKNGITITESKKSLYLAQVAFNRGDYALALERLKEAKLVYALEVKGELNLIYTIKNNPGKSFGVVIFAGLFGWGSSILIRLRLYKRKLKNLAEEEVLLLELMKMVQRQCFEEKKLSMEEYDQAMMQYESKLSETIEDKIRTETKMANLLRASGKRKALDQEKARLIELIRKVQDDYLNKNKIETRIYEGMIKSYSSRLTEVDEQLAYVEAQDALKKHGKIKNMFKV